MFSVNRINKHQLKMGVIALSSANLLFFGAWGDLERYSESGDAYFARYLPQPVHFMATVAAVCIAAGLMWWLTELARRAPHDRWLRAAGVVFVFLFLVPLNALRIEIEARVPLLTSAQTFASSSAPRAVTQWPGYLALGLLIALVVALVWRFSSRFVRFMGSLSVALCPLVVVTFGMSFGSFFWPRDAAELHSPLTASAQPAKHRVVWMLFDEMDQHWLFESPLPYGRPHEIDRLRSESFHATRAYPPASSTLISIPSMVCGQVFSRARPAGPNDLRLAAGRGSATTSWKNMDSLFRTAQSMGVPSEIVGFYHPYCRLFAPELLSCHWEAFWGPAHYPMGYDQSGFFQSMANACLTSAPLPRRLKYGDFRSEQAVQTARLRLEETRRHALVAASNPELGLVFIHWPIPHLPGLNPRQKGGALAPMLDQYLGNLPLVDRELGAVRLAMEQAGVWESTTLIVTSDHWFRLPGAADHRVPLLVNLPGQKTELRYDAPVGTVICRSLIEALLRDEIRSPRGLAQWMDRHRAAAPSPFFPPGTP